MAAPMTSPINVLMDHVNLCYRIATILFNAVQVKLSVPMDHAQSTKTIAPTKSDASEKHPINAHRVSALTLIPPLVK